MIVLGIDTSGYVNAVGVSDGSRVLADFSFPWNRLSIISIPL